MTKTKTKIKNNITYRFVNEANEQEHVLTISGAIGQGGWFYDATSADDVRNALSNVKAKTIRLKISSPGGDVFDGVEIYNYLKDLDAHVIVEVTALAASAASLIAMAGDEIIMRTGSTMMVHEASTMAYGTKSDIQKTMNALDAIDQSIINIYAQKTGLDAEEIKNMIQAETWMTAEEALSKGFATSIETVEEPEPDQNNNINEEIINTIIQRVTAQLENTNKQKEESTPITEPNKPVNSTRRFLF